MLALPDRLTNISHPLVSSMYKKRDFNAPDGLENVLIIETRLSDTDEHPQTSDSALMDLLIDLEDLKEQAEHSVGKIDRIDIRMS